MRKKNKDWCAVAEKICRGHQECPKCWEKIKQKTDKAINFRERKK